MTTFVATEQGLSALSAALNAVSDAVLVVSRSGSVLWLNREAEHMTGWHTQDVTGLMLRDIFHALDPQSGEPIVQILSFDAQNQRECLLLSRDGAQYMVELTTSQWLDDVQQTQGHILVFRDITGSHMVHRQVEFLTHHDPLTGLINRHAFEQQFTQLMRAQRGMRVALLYIDLDQFKWVNETLGHAVGDEMLVQVARLLEKRLRGTDLLANFGGDIFSILAVHVNPHQAELLARSVLESLRSIKIGEGDQRFTVTASIGIVMADGDASVASAEFMRRADVACHIAKREGGNHLYFYVGEDDDKRVMGDMPTVEALKTALANDALLTHFQPILDLPERRLMAYEVLLRLPSSTGDVQFPDQFLPAATNHGLMPAIDKWVIKHAITHLLDTQRDIPRLHINIAGKSLDEKGLLAFITEQLRIAQVDPARLAFEVSEQDIAGRRDVVRHFAQGVRAIGCAFVLDEFGTGFGSFAHLRYLPIDYLKLSDNLVATVATDPLAQALVQSAVQIARAMGRHTIASYVENEHLLQRLGELGVDWVQGFALGAPIAQVAERRDTLKLA
ncbi:MAG: EAL domain-containing protein [Gammaproteobacteria bacterium]|nr:EAL domain-containing protein [Gammaproteobacteria bacterium]